MVERRVMMLREIRNCIDNISFYKKEIDRMDSKIETLERKVRGRGLKIIQEE